MIASAINVRLAIFLRDDTGFLLRCFRRRLFLPSSGSSISRNDSSISDRGTLSGRRIVFWSKDCWLISRSGRDSPIETDDLEGLPILRPEGREMNPSIEGLFFRINTHSTIHDRFLNLHENVTISFIAIVTVYSYKQ